MWGPGFGARGSGFGFDGDRVFTAVERGGNNSKDCEHARTEDGTRQDQNMPATDSFVPIHSSVAPSVHGCVPLV